MGPHRKANTSENEKLQENLKVITGIGKDPQKCKIYLVVTLPKLTFKYAKNSSPRHTGEIICKGLLYASPPPTPLESLFSLEQASLSFSP